MAVDKGGLRYTIRVEDKFSAGLKKFRSEVNAIKKELVGLRTAQTQLNTARRQTTQGAASADRAQLERLRNIQAGVKQQATNEKLRADIFKKQRSEAQAAAKEEITLFRRRKEAEAKAANARTAATRKQAAEQGKLNAKTTQGARALDKVTTSAKRAEGGINRVAFTFRRMVGIFAAFQAARAGADLFRGGIAQGIAFNQTIEDSTISLAALFSTAGSVTDEQGKMLKGAEAFAAAQGAAKDQTTALRVEALGTVATFQELLRAFQAGVGPGLEAGLKLDEIREITVRVSQAAAALTVPQNQLIEEIRSLLRGTITARTTVVASVLGITNADIKNAKTAGNLFEFISGKLKGFSFAADATQASFTGLLARVRDASAAVTGEAASELFDTLKISLDELSKSLVTTDKVAKTITINGEAVKTAKPLFDALRDTLLDLGRIASNVSLDNIRLALGAMGEGIRVLVNLGTGVIQGIVDGFADLSRFVGGFGDDLKGLDLAAITDLVRQFTRIGTILLVINIALGVTKALLFGLVGPAVAVARTIVGLSATMAALAGTTAGVAAAVTGGLLIGLIAAGVALKGILNDFAGFNVKFSTFFRVISEGFINLVTVIGATVNLIFQTITEGVVAVFATAFSEILKTVARGFLAIQQSVALFNTSAAEGVNKAADVLFGASNSLTQTSARSVAEIAKAQADLDAASALLFTDLNDAINDDADGLAPTAAEMATNFVETLTGTIKEGLAGFFPTLLTDEDEDDALRVGAEDKGKAIVEGINEGVKNADQSALLQYFEGIVTNFQNGLSLVRPLVSSLSSFISDSIVAAFDPTDDTDLLERFARFLQQIAKMIIAQLVQIAIAKAVLGFTNGGLGNKVANQAGQGLAEGGDVEGGNAAPRMSRPAGLDPRDTTPIWAQPGEFMVKKSIVDQPAVRDFLKALNGGLIGPSALKGMMGSSSTTRHISGISSRGPQGYAEGGIIQTAANQADAESGGTPNGATPAVMQAAIVANDQTFEKLINGGSNAFKRYVEDNASEIDGILSKNRT